MAKAELEVTVIPPEAMIIFAGIALHAFIAAGKNWNTSSYASEAFDVAEGMMKEAKKRGYAKK